MTIVASCTTTRCCSVVLGWTITPPINLTYYIRRTSDLDAAMLAADNPVALLVCS
jgi:hypothetical protein